MRQADMRRCTAASWCSNQDDQAFQQHKTMAVESAAATLVRKDVPAEVNRFDRVNYEGTAIPRRSALPR